MEEIGKALIASSPVLAVVLLLGMQLLATVKEIAATNHQDCEDASKQRAAIRDTLDDLTRRVKLLEKEQLGEVSPTLPKRPEI